MNESKATRYQRLRRRTHAAAVVSIGLALAVVAFTPLSRGLADIAERASAGWVAPLGAVLALVFLVVPVVAVAEVAALPAVLYQSLVLEGPYVRREDRIDDVLIAHGQATLVALVGALVCGAAVRLAVAVAGPWWWMLAGALLAGGLALAVRGTPAVLRRLGDFRPLARPTLAARLEQLARRSGVQIAAISEWDVTAAAPTTALVTGVGWAKHVLLSPDVARTWSDQEVAVVVAHELAHHAHHDLWRTLALDGLVLIAALGAAHLFVGAGATMFRWGGAEDLAALPALALLASAVWLAGTPLRHAQSRRQERRADAFALATTGQAEAFTTAIRRLGARHLAEEHPSALTRWLYHRHPSVAERLELANIYRCQAGPEGADRDP
jgi:STE24 endopeptidase